MSRLLLVILGILAASVYASNPGILLSTANFPALFGCCAVAINATNFFVIGGSTATTAYISEVRRSVAVPYNVYSLLTTINEAAPRRFHACSIFGSTILLTGGQLSATQDSRGVHTSLDGVTWVTQPVPPWSARELHSLNVMSSVAYLMGGKNLTSGLSNNEVWTSLDTGVSWQQLSPVGTMWAARNAHQTTVFNSFLWVYGGRDDSASPILVFGDVWKSSDGIHWSSVGISGMPSTRYGHSMRGIATDALYIFGGTRTSSGFEQNEWYISKDGVNWCQPIQDPTPFIGARVYMASVSTGGVIYLIGGLAAAGPTYYATVYRTVGAITCLATAQRWVIRSTPPWQARSGHVLSSIPPSLYLMGGTVNGTDQGVLNDVWTSPDGGSSWSQLSNAPWSPRRGHRGLLFSPLGQIMILGGQNVTGGYQNDLWMFDGTIWTQLTPPTLPVARSYGGFSTDGTRLFAVTGRKAGELPELTCYYSTLSGSFTDWTLATTSVSQGAIQSAGIFWSTTIYQVGGKGLSGVYGTAISRTPAQLIANVPATQWTVQTAAAPWQARSGHALSDQMAANSLLVIAGSTGLTNSNATFDVWTTDTGALWTQTYALPLPFGRAEQLYGNWVTGRVNLACTSLASTTTMKDTFCTGGLSDTANTTNEVFLFTNNACTGAPCKNSATCVYGYLTTFSCICAVGWSGAICASNINECASLPCQNGATCVDAVNGFTCTCVAGYSGVVCQTDINECASLPCANGGTCVDNVGSFSCICVAGYVGQNCQTDFNECTSLPCANGGTCVDNLNSFTCLCVAGYTGLQCQTDVNECGSNPCVNGGTCHDNVNSYTCICLTGFSGLQCQTDINECASVPCQNGGTCADHLGSFTCTCVAGWSGLVCQTDVNECGSVPCQNGGTCVDHLNSFSCTCIAGWSGLLCQTDVNECGSNPCANGGTCHDNVNSYTCVCPPGYSGTQCQTDVNECGSIPCQNGGTCVDHLGSFTCTCVAGWSGLVCQTDVNECASNPCQNSGTCVDHVNSFSCTCIAGWSGLLCQTDINECGSNPCVNGGTCHDNLNSYTCICIPGFSGLQCQTDANECASLPCQNGGSCTDLANGYTCTCPTGYSGLQCQTQINECGSNPCQNGATCIDLINGFMCTCVPGYGGLLCQTDIDECASNPCQNGGSCNDNLNGFICTCACNMGDPLCSTTFAVSACASSVNNSCPAIGPAFPAFTLPGYISSWSFITNTGNTVINGSLALDPGTLSNLAGFPPGVVLGGVEITTSTARHVHSDSVIVYLFARNSVQTVFPDVTDLCGMTLLAGVYVAAGDLAISCTAYFDARGNPDSSLIIKVGGSLTSSLGANFIRINRALSVNMLWQVTLDASIAAGTNFSGSVLAGRSITLGSGANLRGRLLAGAQQPGGITLNNNRIEANVETDPAAANHSCIAVSCQNGGSCVSQLNNTCAIQCLCPIGTFGFLCENLVDTCASFPCRNGGQCNEMVNGYTCTCPVGYSGLICQTNINECGSNPCTNGGTCVDGDAGFTCTCSAGYSGVLCQTDINECGSNPCQNGGTCVDSLNMYTCLCAVGWSGLLCQTDINECGSNPCQNGGTCQDQIGSYICICPVGSIGLQCQTNVNECASNPCVNGGTCVDGLGSFTCTCATGYSGTLCQTDVNECGSNPCQNSGTCVDGVNGFTCLCVAGWSGLLCQTDINECASNPCSNGGTCQDHINSYTCICPVGSIGLRCETNPDECVSAPCVNGGTCVDGLDSYSCTCLPGYSGSQCQTAIVECASFPCQNGGTCAGSINGYTCICVPGFSGLRCQTDISECGSAPCKNGATCVDGTSSFTCMCAAGYSGVLCETDANECASNPCRNGGTCVDHPNSFTCVCVSGWGGLVCQTDTNECASNPCQNSGTCVDGLPGFTCMCTTGWSGLLCQTNTNECASNPCVGNATCVDGIGSFTCVCGVGYIFRPHSVTDCVLDLCRLISCPPAANCTVVEQLNVAICACPVGLTGDNCDQSVFIPDRPITGQGGWGRGTYNASGVSDLMEEVRTPAPQFVLQGVASWFVSNVNATPGSFVFTPPFNKTNGEASIGHFLSGGQFYGGNTFSTLSHIHVASATPDGTRMAISIGSNINLNSSATVAIDYRNDTGLTLTVVTNSTNQTVIHNLDPSVFHAIYMKVRTYPGRNNDVLRIELDGIPIYIGPSLEPLYPEAQPMNNMRFELGRPASAIGFPDGSPNGAYVDVYFESVFNSTDADDFFGTSFENGLCANASSPCVLNNGTCVAANNYTVCICPAGRSGDVCQNTTEIISSTAGEASTAGVLSSSTAGIPSSTAGAKNETSSTGAHDESSPVLDTAAIVLICVAAVFLFTFALCCINTGLGRIAEGDLPPPPPPDTKEKRGLMREDSDSLELSDFEKEDDEP